MRFIVHVLLLSLLVFGTGCAYFTTHGKLTRTARQHFVSGRLDDAVLEAVKALRITPGYADAQQVLLQSFPIARRRHLDAIETLRARSAEFTGSATVTNREQIVSEYADLIRITQEVSSLPPIANPKTGQILYFPYEDYNSLLAEASGSLQEARIDAAAMYYQNGLTLRKAEGKDAARLAARAFKLSLSYVDGYRDAEVKYLEAKTAGTRRIGLLGFDAGVVWPAGQDLGERLPDALVRRMATPAARLEFTQLVSRADVMQEARAKRIRLDQAPRTTVEAISIGKRLGLDQVIIGRVETYKAEPAATRSSTYDESREVVVDQESFTGQDGRTYQRDVVDNVYARVYQYEKSANARATVAFRLIDVQTGATIAAGSPTANQQWRTQWANFRGNKQALSDAALNLVNSSEEPYPGDRALLNQALAEVLDKMGQSLVNHMQ